MYFYITFNRNNSHPYNICRNGQSSRSIGTPKVATLFPLIINRISYIAIDCSIRILYSQKEMLCELTNLKLRVRSNSLCDGFPTARFRHHADTLTRSGKPLKYLHPSRRRRKRENCPYQACLCTCDVHRLDFRQDYVEACAKFLFRMGTTLLTCRKVNAFRGIIRNSITFDYKKVIISR